MRTSKIGFPDLLIATSISVIAVTLGYVALGILPSLIFTLGFLGGLAVWLLIGSRATWRDIRTPFILTLVLFFLHKQEEKRMGFFDELATITGVPPPTADSVLAYALLGTAALWLLIPFLVGKRSELGYYLSWTFFCSMGVTELAHFFFPLMRDGPYEYFPGMFSVVGLAPVAWWGIWKLLKASPPSETSD